MYYDRIQTEFSHFLKDYHLFSEVALPELIERFCCYYCQWGWCEWLFFQCILCICYSTLPNTELCTHLTLCWALFWLGTNQSATQPCHYDDVIMVAMASQISSLTIVYSSVYSGADQRKHQSSVSIWWRHYVYIAWTIMHGPSVNSVQSYGDIDLSQHWLRYNAFLPDDTKPLP